MSAKYILRIDDVCPTMKWEAFKRIQEACDELNIQPIIGVVPDNQDQNLVVESVKQDFWEYIKNLADKKWIIAQHGFQHIYGNTKSEFAGLSYQEQFEKIHTGKNILEQKLGISSVWFMAPAHSMDDTTCKALVDLSFTHITDGVALYPFIKDGLIWVPQQLWRPAYMPFGLWTICLHVNTMSAHDIDALLVFLHKYAKQFQHVSLEPRQSMLNMPFSTIWHTVKKIKNIWPI